ncbi:MAG TPA: LuxR C-terminal-related transcriptional regulator [Actinophytocola sp.]|uniref:helix-turn-helix transcriptional regulator n=1 Tax=Actinophytocola sp. TaxID=1872138 RepID=UPI002DB9C16B|nr:LuxR C-terminal-related transcriptional regulator [Actinophytocola sp.]HEU5474456.1 LuxR C-terminal-related transcriptional regulator [Actinophytocola sp.]
MVATNGVTSSVPAVLRGREKELATLHDALTRARNGYGTALVVLAESGMGKTTLLDALRPVTTDFLTLETAGIATEAALPLSGLHRLLQPLADRVRMLPGSYARTLVPVIAEGAVPSEDTFALHAAVHRLLADTAGAIPLLCRADDVHRMDRLSVDALTFAARRLAGDPVVVLFTSRVDDGDLLSGIPRLPLSPLNLMASQQVLLDRLDHGLPGGLVEDLVELASGNPLALVELADALTVEQLSGEVPGPDALPSHSRMRGLLRRRFLRLSPDARRLTTMAVVDDQLDTDTVVRTATDAGIDLSALEEAASSGLIRLDSERVEVPSPLIRSTLYADVPLAERQAAHRLLAGVLHPEQDRLRWTWQRVALAEAPRHQLADELDAAAAAARETGDYAASARAYQRAAALTAQPDAKALRLIAAATDSSFAGRSRHARALLRQAVPFTTTSPELRGLADLLQGEIELRDGMPAIANEVLLTAATELIDSNRTLAITALMLAGDASCLTGNYQHYVEVAERAARLRRPDEPPSTGQMFDHFEGMTATYAGRHAEAVAPLRRVIAAAETTNHPMSTIWASEAAYTLGDAVLAQELATKAVSTARAHGFAVLLPWAMVYLSMSAMLHDRHITAMTSSLDGMRVAAAIGQQNCVVDHLTILALLAALLGDRETALLRLESAAAGTRARGLGRPSALSSWAVACVDLADDRPADALDRLRLMAAGTGYVHPAIRAMAAPHFVEAAVRCGEGEKAEHALEIFDQWANSTGSTPRLAQSHRCHALLAGNGAHAEEHFREAIRLHRASNTAFELAKTELFFAHQLRRSRKPRAAREHLRDALKIFQQYDAELWAERTRSELRAAGETVAANRPRTAAQLTPQQEQIAALVAEGATNREIAAQLVVSPRTVDHHLRNIFTKLGVRSRVELTALFR